MTPNTVGFDADVISDAVSALFDKVGNGILVTHSQGGGPGWFTAIKNDGVKAVVAYEPYSSFLFPEGELPEPIKSSGLFGEFNGQAVPLSEFLQHTKIHNVNYNGDNIAKEPHDVCNKAH